MSEVPNITVCLIFYVGEKLVAYTVEGETLNISCPEGQVIKIESANFGRSVSLFLFKAIV